MPRAGRWSSGKGGAGEGGRDSSSLGAMAGEATLTCPQWLGCSEAILVTLPGNNNDLFLKCVCLCAEFAVCLTECSLNEQAPVLLGHLYA